MRYVLLLLCALSLADAQQLLRPFELKDTAMVPVGYVAEWLGAAVTPDAATGSMVVRLGEKTVTWSARADGAAAYPYPAPVLEGGILYVPAKAFNVEFGVAVKRVDKHPELIELANPTSVLDVIDLPLLPKGMAFTPLQLDLLDFRLTAARKRLAAGVDVNQRDGKGMTALHTAVELRQFQLIDELAAKGANLNLAGADGRSPLLRLLAGDLLFTKYSRYAGQSHLFYRNEVQDVDKIFAQLLRLKANVNQADAVGATPLHLAAAWAVTPEYLDALFRAGANPNVKDKQGRTPLQCTVHVAPYTFDDVKQDVVMTFLNHGAAPTLVSPRGWTLMHYAAMWNDAALVADLKKKGLSPTAPERIAGWTPLHVAARFCTLKAAQALLAAGASVNGKDARGGTPLHLAAEMGQTTAITWLLGKGASLTATNTLGMPPVHMALLAKKVDTVKQLLAAGATLNYRVDGWTPLMVAVNDNDVPMVKLLLGKGVDVNAVTSKKFGALYFRDGNAGANKAYGTVPYGDMTALHVAAMADQRLEVARILLAAKAHINAPAREGYTPLHYAAAVGSANIAKLLLTSTPRADVNAKTKQSKTPLALAAANKMTAMVGVLKGYGGK